MTVVYVITNSITGKRYIGCTSQPLPIRKAGHVWKARQGSPFPLHQDIMRFGPDVFTIEPQLVCDDTDTCTEYEKFLIEELNTRSPDGYNVAAGGPGNAGHVPTTEARAKMGHKGNRMNARLTIDDVREIRRRYSEGNVTLKALAAEYGVSFTNISAIVNYKTWKDV